MRIDEFSISSEVGNGFDNEEKTRFLLVGFDTDMADYLKASSKKRRLAFMDMFKEDLYGYYRNNN